MSRGSAAAGSGIEYGNIIIAGSAQISCGDSGGELSRADKGGGEIGSIPSNY